MSVQIRTSIPITTLEHIGKEKVTVCIEVLKKAVCSTNLSAMAIKNILFDLGETLLLYGKIDVDAFFRQGAEQTYEFLRRYAPDTNKLPSFKWYYRRHILSIKWHCLWAFLSRREFNCLNLIAKRMTRMGLRASPEQLQELAWRWYEPLSQCTHLEEGLKETLFQLHRQGRRMAIVSNVFLPGFVLDRQLEKVDLLSIFPIRIYSSDTIFRKPHPRIYRIALERLGANPAQTVMVGDKFAEDIRGPGRLGIRGIFKRSVSNARKHIPADVPIIERIAQLPALLDRLDADNS